QVLESELDFISKGGYDPSVRTPHVPAILFQDSPICPEFQAHTHTHECLLMQFVPEDRKSQPVPCHHIPLNEKGDTVERLLAERGQEQAQEALKHWLEQTIHHLKQDRRDPIEA
ncbi:MAG TPA: hypothetical protein VI756_05600, partial [Blastocatellia bacterium]